MSQTICLPINYLLVIFCIFIGLSAWYIQNNKNNDGNILKEITKKINDLEITKKMNDLEITNKINNLETDTELYKINNTKKINNLENTKRKIYITKRDEEVLYNDFKPPERRVPETQYPYNYVKTQLNIPTRGFPDNYQLLGVLLRDNTETAYNLFGRQKFPGSNQYEYYVQGNMQYNSVKLPLQVQGERELDDGQIVQVPGTDPSKGDFKVKLYSLDTPRYIPIV